MVLQLRLHLCYFLQVTVSIVESRIWWSSAETKLIRHAFVCLFCMFISLFVCSLRRGPNAAKGTDGLAHPLPPAAHFLLQGDCSASDFFNCY